MSAPSRVMMRSISASITTGAPANCTRSPARMTALVLATKVMIDEEPDQI